MALGFMPQPSQLPWLGSSSLKINCLRCYRMQMRSLCTTTSNEQQQQQQRQQAAAPDGLKKKAVAGSFIFKFPNDDISQRPQVALFRRSGAVKSYQHKYAPISGSVEPGDANPLATAWREIHEETSLTDSSLRLFRRGKPYSFVDASIGREWAINPFSFVLRPGAEDDIRLDWEHEGYAWFDPRKLGAEDTFEGVPRLMDSLRRVFFELDLGDEAGKVLADGLYALRANVGGDARLLASKASDTFLKVIQKVNAGYSQDIISRDAWWRNVRFVGWHIWRNGHEGVDDAVLGAVVSYLEAIEKRLPTTEGPMSKVWAQAIENVLVTVKCTVEGDAKQRADHYFSGL